MGCTTKIIDNRSVAVCDCYSFGCSDAQERDGWSAARNISEGDGPVFEINDGYALSTGWRTVSESSPLKTELYGLKVGFQNIHPDEKFVGIEVGAVNEAVSVDGLQLGFENHIATRLFGIQFGAYNDSTEVIGLQVAAVMNDAAVVNGAQVALVANKTAVVRGIQASVMANRSNVTDVGLQLALGMNISCQSLSGLQISTINSHLPLAILGVGVYSSSPSMQCSGEENNCAQLEKGDAHPSY